MLIAYKEKTDKKDNINRFSVGDRVLNVDETNFWSSQEDVCTLERRQEWASIYCCYDYRTCKLCHLKLFGGHKNLSQKYA